MQNHLNKDVYIMGHIHPDTDSICSAIAYANLKSKLISNQNFLARRTGRLNEETIFVLDKFGINSPEYIADVRTQISDIDIRMLEGVPKEISLKKAWTLMKDANVVTLPLTMGGELEGLITIKDIVTAYMDVYDSRILSMAKTSIQNVLDTLDGVMVVGNQEANIERGKIIIAAGSPEAIEDVIEDGDIVIASNRYEAQFCAIQMNAELLIVCTGSPVSKSIKKLAEEKGCMIISTPHDTYSATRLINQSAPVSYFMRKENLISFKTDDFIEDVKKVMVKYKYRDFPVLDRHGRYCGMLSRRFLLNTKNKKVILVDHNEKSQAVDGIEEAEILEIIDHHRLGAIETMSPVYFRNQPVGSTATIIYMMYKENKVELVKSIAGILCSAILSDTLAYKSPTCTEEDKKAGEILAEIAEISTSEYAKEMFAAGSKLSEKPADEIFNQDFKKFAINGIDFGVGQINSMNEIELKAIRKKIEPYLEKVQKEHGLDMVFFMLTNILTESTEMICSGEDSYELLKRSFEDEFKGVKGKIVLKNLVSRKKQFIPLLMRGMQE